MRPRGTELPLEVTMYDGNNAVLMAGEAPSSRPENDRAVAYAAEVLSRVPWLLSQLDREPDSITYGCFDREHWGWKFRDFPLGMLQTSIYPLALLWRFPFSNNPYHNDGRVLHWIVAAMEFALARQHANGAFDAFSPNEQDAGTTLGVVHGLSEAFRLTRAAVSPAAQGRFLKRLRKACDFAIKRDENHAFISNHRALFAVAFLDARELLGDEKYLRRAEEIIEQILRAQSPDGWYREYDGPDPGYETLGIFHLATYWRRTRSPRLLASLKRSVEFFAHCVHPDGSVGGNYGSRQTALYFPAGFEILADEVPMAAAVARFMSSRLSDLNVVTPAVAEAENLPPLAYTYLEASIASQKQQWAEVQLLPCESLKGVRHFPDSELSVAGSEHYYAVVNASRGGVCRVFSRQAGRIAYEDAGYSVRSGRRRWSSQFIGLGHISKTSRQDEVGCVATLGEVRQIVPTPARFVVLRLLNLTLFRSLSLGNWIRRLIVKRLVTATRKGPLRLRRTIVFGADRITFRDLLETTKHLRVEEITLPRAFTAMHMGSAKYFHSSQLAETLQAPVGDMASRLTRDKVARCEFTLVFDSAAPPRLVDTYEAGPNP